MSEARILIVEGAGLAPGSLVRLILQNGAELLFREADAQPAQRIGKTNKLCEMAEGLPLEPAIFYEPRKRAQWKDELHRPHGRRR